MIIVLNKTIMKSRMPSTCTAFIHRYKLQTIEPCKIALNCTPNTSFGDLVQLHKKTTVYTKDTKCKISIFPHLFKFDNLYSLQIHTFISSLICYRRLHTPLAHHMRSQHN